MYNADALKRKISKEGFLVTINYLLSDDLPREFRNSLEENHLFINGLPCLSLIFHE